MKNAIIGSMVLGLLAATVWAQQFFPPGSTYIVNSDGSITATIPPPAQPPSQVVTINLASLQHHLADINSKISVLTNNLTLLQAEAQATQTAITAAQATLASKVGP